MSEIINLNHKRKAKARMEEERKASENRIKFGRTKEEKKIEKLNIESAAKHLEGHKRETAEDE